MRFLTKKLLALAAFAAPTFAGVEADSTDDFQRFSAVPIIGYTEETKYQFGAMAIIFFRPEFEGGNATELDLSFYGTTRKQVTGSISPKFYFLKDQISGELDLHYDNWVGNYFGRGNNPDIDDFRKFDRRTFYLTSLTESNFGTKQWLKDFRYGFFFEINYTDIDLNRYHYHGKRHETGQRDIYPFFKEPHT